MQIQRQGNKVFVRFGNDTVKKAVSEIQQHLASKDSNFKPTVVIDPKKK